MSYEIRTYQESFLDDQERIGKSVYANYLVGAQTPAKQLRIAYSKEGFDPSTKFYAFDGDTMVGFCTGGIQERKEGEPLSARLEFPFVSEGHEAARDQLYNHAIGVLKSRGVEKVIVRAGRDWGYTLDYALSEGYQQSSVIIRAMTVNPQELTDDYFEGVSEVTDFDPADLDALTSAFQKAYNINDEDTLRGLRSSMETLADDYDVVSHKVIKSGDEIVGRHLFYSRGGNRAVLTGSFLLLGDDTEAMRMTLLKAGLKSVKDAGRTQVQITVGGNKPDEESKYADLGQFYDAWVFMEKLI